MSGFRILVVEDDPEWSTALCDMFQELFGSCPQTATSKSVAERMLSDDSRWDIVSLDLNLREGQKTHESRDVGEYLLGEELLETIEMNGCARFVICCTGIHSDRKIKALVRDDRDGIIRRTMATVPYQLTRLFPDRSLFLPKNQSLGVRENIEDLKGIIASLRNPINLACGKKGKIKLFVDEQALLVSFRGNDALVVFPKKQGFVAAEWLCYLLKRPWSEWNRRFTPDEVFHLRDIGQPTSVKTRLSGAIAATMLGSESAGNDEGYAGGGFQTGKPAFNTPDIRALRLKRDELACGLGIKARRNEKNAWQVAIQTKLGDLSSELEEARARHDLIEQERIEEKFAKVLELDNLEKIINELSRDPDYEGDVESNKVQTYLSRLLTLLRKKHPEVWELLAPEGKGGLRFVSDGGYCYDDVRSGGVKWDIE